VPGDLDSVNLTRSSIAISYLTARLLPLASASDSFAPPSSWAFRNDKPKYCKNTVENTMAIDKETVAKIARLARIKVPEAEQEALAEELSNILGWVEQLSEVDTAGVEPMTSVVDAVAPRRPDEVTDGGYSERVTANAPDAVDGFYTVPKVVE
jgi:aspartyl-tRNA(Asn)/glutamyl-tRNA(Gln) amidotransferase subunit C